MSEELRLGLAVGFVVVVGGFVAWRTFRNARQITGGRTLLQELARALGSTWTPPKNPADRLSAGRVKGRYRGRGVTAETERQRGGMNRHGLPAAVVRVRLGRPLGMNLHGGSGHYRARKGAPVDLTGPLAGALRLGAQDHERARALLADPRVVHAIGELERIGWGTKLDDGTVEMRFDFPSSVGGFMTALDQAVDAAEAIDQAMAQELAPVDAAIPRAR